MFSFFIGIIIAGMLLAVLEEVITIIDCGIFFVISSSFVFIWIIVAGMILAVLQKVFPFYDCEICIIFYLDFIDRFFTY